MTAPRRIDVRKLLLGLVLASAVGCLSREQRRRVRARDCRRLQRRRSTAGPRAVRQRQDAGPGRTGHIRGPEHAPRRRDGRVLDVHALWRGEHPHQRTSVERDGPAVLVPGATGPPDRLGGPRTGRPVDVGGRRQGCVRGPGRTGRPRPVPDRRGIAPLRLTPAVATTGKCHSRSRLCCASRHGLRRGNVVSASSVR